MAPRELSKRSHSASCWAPHLSIASETLRIPNAPISITKATHTTFSPPFSFHSGAQPITAAKKSVLEKKDVAAAIREYEEDSETETEGEQAQLYPTIYTYVGYWTTQLWNSVETLRFLPHRFLNPIELRRLAPAPLHTDAIKENSPENGGPDYSTTLVTDGSVKILSFKAPRITCRNPRVHMMGAKRGPGHTMLSILRQEGV
ncbi:hypothetical protein B0H10DRAFT_2197932 [Mycena sp. CBHHK59/15]|nr:hypothetical protein B0H10DRAFT_2197932 [Mycena sp. CBHHK59/15]